MRSTNLGEFEELVLLSVGVLNNDAYGISIKDMIKEQTGRKPSIGALHTALNRLEKKSFVRSFLEDATGERRGRRKRYFELTASGRQALIQVHEQRSSMLEQIPNIQVT